MFNIYSFNLVPIYGKGKNILIHNIFNFYGQ
ncbi:protein of unknown function [Nitrospina watsonii]|uniref:Uncharacterized protein n=1 Tax=Nitrospina watsonii TaxID=1323948 RepID=A0ABN8VYU1_9BACT|nr:protein of unknown function [Nitrospina watsonii]